MKNENKLIAEFMELPTEVFKSGIYEENELSYNTSWECLMPVVDKIESMRNLDGDAYRFFIDMCNVEIENTDIIVLGASYKRDAVYNAVVEFIKNEKL
jgi:hypothetical protein